MSEQFKRMALVYVAGPFRADSAWGIEQNIRRAEEVALEVWRLGAAALCPHTNCRFFTGAADDSVWLAGDIEMLRRCDAAVFVHGWQKSSGAMLEHKFCLEHGINAFHTIGELRSWLEMTAVCGAAVKSALVQQ